MREENQSTSVQAEQSNTGEVQLSYRAHSVKHQTECRIINAEWRSWWQGWPSGESTCLPPMWPGFDFRTRCHMWIEFVGSLLCYERFSPGYSGFPLSSKNQHLIWFVNNDCKIIIWAMLIWFPLELQSAVDHIIIICRHACAFSLVS